MDWESAGVLGIAVASAVLGMVSLSIHGSMWRQSFLISLGRDTVGVFTLPFDHSALIMWGWVGFLIPIPICSWEVFVFCFSDFFTLLLLSLYCIKGYSTPYTPF